MNLLSLFTGIGAFDLGLQRAGMTVVGQVEIDPFCRSVLARHWPEVPRHDDARTAVDWWASTVRPPVDIVTGGPPCQPFSVAGRLRGVSDPRWMWPAMADVVRALRPRFVVLENVVGLVRDTDAFGWILGDLADLGFDAQWSVLSACALGAPHARERLFLVAYPNTLDGPPRLGVGSGRPLQPETGGTRAWRDRVERVLASPGPDDRDTDGLARWMVAAGGNAVVVPAATHIGHAVMALS